MIPSAKKKIKEFVLEYNRYCSCYSEEIDAEMIQHELLRAPHERPKKRLKKDKKCAVYVFSLKSEYKCPANGDRVLKVGFVGSNSSARFNYQHYKLGSANSILAGSLQKNRELWRYLGIKQINDYESWLKENTDRDHFFLYETKSSIAKRLEIYLRGILGPVFEGS